ncbi:heme-binding protein [Crocosphaera sp.]|uniref:heme-binding protein n=1 Tax=Crocosphaera sp. TaxID=2729996 RepID=UPI00257D9210|nr:heme-binding protein [Crocosphaera sp.]NQZ65130.1 heme-binding protein [Crocosphaera sp.]
MKPHYLFLPIGIIAIAWFAFGIYQANSAPLPVGFPAPTPPDKIEVKQYPAYRAATYNYSGNLSEASNRAFSSLFQHISSNDISMTAPVETRYPLSTLESNEKTGEATVSFLYRNTDIYPQEIANNITVEDIPAMTVVSLGLQGGYSYESYQQGLEKLKNWLSENPDYQMVGKPRRLFYDGPYKPDAAKRSEIQIPVTQ